MGATQRILHGGRAQLIVDGKVRGVFTSVSWGLQYDAVPSYILGRMSPAEITYVGQEAVSVNATGFRVVDNGAFVAGAMPKLQDLLVHEDISLAIFDRQTNKQILTVTGVRPVGYSSGTSARGVSDFSVSFLGMLHSDESGEANEAAGATTLTSGT